MPIFIGIHAELCFRSCLSSRPKMGMNFLNRLQRFYLPAHPLYSEGL
ncbi:MAG TPA: hypothetical protein H9778_05000 [Candidatus Parabacteroides intestinavium]|nr:hypothetical protein [Candidatus Parabacteroides intestinavium]